MRPFLLHETDQARGPSRCRARGGGEHDTRLVVTIGRHGHHVVGGGVGFEPTVASESPS
jgi:hypothetical protein